MRKSERIPLRCEVEFRRQLGNRYAVDLHNLSVEGCCISPPLRVQQGEGVWVFLPGLEATRGQVVWVEEWRVGVEFDRPFHAAVYDNLIRRLDRAP